MAVYHTVEQGEHLSGIAHRYGFASYLTIWDHPENSELKKKRQNPNVLFPGDRLFIPDRELKEIARSTEQRHRFQVKTTPLKLRLRLEECLGEPIANTKCELRVEFDDFKLTTDGEGKLEHPIPKTAQKASLVIKDAVVIRDREIPLDTEIPIRIGHLDPVEERSGQQARLANLGYYRGPAEPTDEKELLSAIEEFQCDHKLVVDGICGPRTQAKLKEVHGC